MTILFFLSFQQIIYTYHSVNKFHFFHDARFSKYRQEHLLSRHFEQINPG